MAHIDKEQLYALFHALVRHRDGEAPIPNVELDEELEMVLGRIPAESFEEAPAPQHVLTPERIQQILAHARKCKECEIVLCEDGPHAKRLKTAEEVAKEHEIGEEEAKQLTWKFFVSITYAVAAFFVAEFFVYKIRHHPPKEAFAGPTVQGTDPQLGINPLWIVVFLLILIAAWGIAEAWRIANLLWLDWTKAKEAVPLIGKRWAARSKRRKEQMHDSQR